jgi:hypothetical protein
MSSSSLPQPSAGVATPVVRAVAEDLEAIFPPEPAARPAVGARLRLRGGSRDRGSRARSRDRRAASLGALVAAACVGVSAGALIVRAGAPTKPAPPAISPGPPIALALPTPGPLAPAIVPPAPSAMVFARASAGLTRPSAKLRAISASRATAPHRKSVRTVALRHGGAHSDERRSARLAGGAETAVRLAHTQPASAKPAIHGGGPMRTASVKRRCASPDPGAALACADPALSAAERQVDSLYRQAEAAGVPPERLERQQQQWLSARAATARQAPWAMRDVYLARIAELRDQARPQGD